MERRKFVVGLGALASGSAAAVGTGAFTSVTADRSVDVEVAGDANAYLGLQQIAGSPNSQQYVTNSSGEIGFDFSSNNGNVNGTGFNPDAVTDVEDLLLVTNQGTQDVDFHVDLSSVTTGSATITVSCDGDVTSSDVVGSGNSVNLSPGDAITLDLTVDSTGQGPASDLDGTVTFVAEAP